MLSAELSRWREAEARLQCAAFAAEFALGTSYAHRIRDVDVIPPGCSKDHRWRNGLRCAESRAKKFWPSADNHNDLEMLSFAGIPCNGEQRAGPENLWLGMNRHERREWRGFRRLNDSRCGRLHLALDSGFTPAPLLLLAEPACARST